MNASGAVYGIGHAMAFVPHDRLADREVDTGVLHRNREIVPERVERQSAIENADALLRRSELLLVCMSVGLVRAAWTQLGPQVNSALFFLLHNVIKKSGSFDCW